MISSRRGVLVLETGCFPAAHSWISVRQVHCGTILHVKAAAVICHSLSRLQRSLLCTHQGLLSMCTAAMACTFVIMAVDTLVGVCSCVSVRCLVVPACVLKGQGAPLASRASLQAMPWARKLKTSSRGGNCLWECVCVFNCGCLPARFHVSLNLPAQNKWSQPVWSHKVLARLQSKDGRLCKLLLSSVAFAQHDAVGATEIRHCQPFKR